MVPVTPGYLGFAWEHHGAKRQVSGWGVPHFFSPLALNAFLRGGERNHKNPKTVLVTVSKSTETTSSNAQEELALNHEHKQQPPAEPPPPSPLWLRPQRRSLISPVDGMPSCVSGHLVELLPGCQTAWIPGGLACLQDKSEMQTVGKRNTTSVLRDSIHATGTLKHVFACCWRSVVVCTGPRVLVSTCRTTNRARQTRVPMALALLTGDRAASQCHHLTLSCTDSLFSLH